MTAFPATPIEAAMAYLSLGYRVVPLCYPKFKDGSVRCSCGNTDEDHKNKIGKHPLVVPGVCRNGAKSPLTTPEQVWRVWIEHPQANVGIWIDTSRAMLVVDVDPRNGGFESLERLLRETRAPLPEYPVAQTGQYQGERGLHFYLRYEPGLALAGALDEFPGIDFISHKNKYVVAPPSMHCSGVRYRWMTSDLDVLRVIPEAPLPLVALLADSGAAGIEHKVVGIKQEAYPDPSCRNNTTSPPPQFNSYTQARRLRNLNHWGDKVINPGKSYRQFVCRISGYFIRRGAENEEVSSETAAIISMLERKGAWLCKRRKAEAVAEVAAIVKSKRGIASDWGIAQVRIPVAAIVAIEKIKQLLERAFAFWCCAFGLLGRGPDGRFLLPYDTIRSYLELATGIEVGNSSIQYLICKYMSNGILSDYLEGNHRRARKYNPDDDRSANSYRFKLTVEWQSEDYMLQDEAADKLGLPPVDSIPTSISQSQWEGMRPALLYLMAFQVLMWIRRIQSRQHRIAALERLERIQARSQEPLAILDSHDLPRLRSELAAAKRALSYNPPQGRHGDG